MTPDPRSRTRNTAPILGQATARPKAERPRSQRPMLLFVLGVLIALGGLSVLLLRPHLQSYTLRSYTTARVSRGTVQDDVSATGSVVSQLSRTVNSPVAGTLESVDVAEGDEVRAGQPLARIDAPELKQAVQKAQEAVVLARNQRDRDLLAAQATLDGARSDELLASHATTPLEQALMSTREVYALGGVPRQDVDAAITKVEDARLAVQAAILKVREASAALSLTRTTADREVSFAQLELRNAEGDLGRAVLTSPIGGRVVSIKAETGQQLSVGTELLSVASLTHLRIDAQIDESLAGRVRPGQEVDVTVGTQTLPGEVRTVAAEASGGSAAGSGAAAATGPRTVAAQIVFTQAPQNVRLGNSVGLDIIVGRRPDALTLPRGEYLTSGGQQFVYVLTGDGTRAERRTVTFGNTGGQQIEITQGLVQGDRVVTSTYEAFKDQEQVQVSPGGDLGGGTR